MRILTALAGHVEVLKASRRRELFVSALGFLAVVIVVHAQVVFLGRSLVPTDNYNPLDPRPTAANYGPAFVPPAEWYERGITSYPNFHDPGGSWWQGEPALNFFRRAILDGQFPFWDPYAAAGAPAYTNLTSQFLFPPQVLLALCGATSTQKNVYILILFWLCGLATYWLMRTHKVGIMGSAAAGLVFMLSGAVQEFGPPMFVGQVITCIPLLALATRWFVARPTWSRSAVLAFFYALAALASFPPVLFMAFAFSGLLFLCHLVVNKQLRAGPAFLRYGTALVLCVGLTALYYIPAIVTVQATAYAREFYRTAGLEAADIVSLFDLFSPTAFGGANIYAAPVLTKPHTGELFYVGATALLLLPVAFGRHLLPARPLRWAGVIGGLLVLLKVFGIPPVQWIALLPGLQTFHYDIYFGILLAFVIALLAGIGLDRLASALDGKIAVLSGVLLVGIGLTALWFVAKASGAFKHPESWRWVADFEMLAVFALLGSVFVLVGRATSRRWIRLLSCGLLLATITAEGIANASYPRQMRWDVFQHPPEYVKTLKAMAAGSRVFTGAALNANLASAFGIETLDSLYMFVPPRIYQLYRRYTGSTAAVSMREPGQLPPDAVFQRAGIAFLAIRHDAQWLFESARRRKYSPVFDDGYVEIFRRAPAPHYAFTSDYEVTSPDVALNSLKTVPVHRLLLEEGPGCAAAQNEPDDPVPEVVSEKLNSITVRMNAPRPGLIYIADSFYEGWSATVNRREVRILPANYAFRAVPVSAGPVQLELSYRPAGFRTGVIISFVSVALALVIAIGTTGKTEPPAPLSA